MVKIVIDPSCLNQGGSTYDDTEVLNRIKALEGRTDNFVKDVTVSRDGDKVKFTYTRVDGTSSEVEFDDKDTISVAYDDTALKERIKALEAKEDKQTLSLEGSTLSISNGNSVTLPVGVGKEFIVTSDTEGVVVTKTEADATTTYNVNLDNALDKYYEKAETYTKKEVDNLLTNQENKATDLTVYRGSFTDRSKVMEGEHDAPISPRVTLTYSSSTGIGIFKIDFKVTSKVNWRDVIATLPPEAPVPVELVESQVWIGNNNTSVWIGKGSRNVQIFGVSNPEMFNKRIILSIPGIFKKA
jgi:hypothetical protein